MALYGQPIQMTKKKKIDIVGLLKVIAELLPTIISLFKKKKKNVN